MKNFFTAVPLQKAGQLSKYVYNAVGNEKLNFEKPIYFPIFSAIAGYVEKGVEFQLVAVVIDNEDCKNNFELMKKELEELCKEREYKFKIKEIVIPADNRVSVHIDTFQSLIDTINEDDELFACTTFGTKPLSSTIQMAIQYGYRVKKNTNIGCIVYGQIDRSNPNKEEWTGKIYDETALIRLDEIVRVLADRKVENPRDIIRHIIEL